MLRTIGPYGFEARISTLSRWPSPVCALGAASPMNKTPANTIA
jgi:hypothetical protein